MPADDVCAISRIALRPEYTTIDTVSGARMVPVCAIHLSASSQVPVFFC
jgi:hypothetical protein